MSNKVKGKKIAANKSTKLKPSELALLFGAAGVYFFYVKSNDVLLNYPSWLSKLLFVSILVIAFMVKWKSFVDSNPKNDRIDQSLYWAFSVVKVSIFSWFLTGAMLIPFNYYSIYLSKDQPVERVECEITGISTFSKNRKVFYKLYNDTNVTYGYKPIMSEIENDARFENYYFIAHVRKGLLGAYVLEEWDIQKR